MKSVRQLTDDLSVISAELRTVVDSDEGDFGDQVANIKNSLAQLDESLQNLSEITSRVERGEGTVGRLLTDEALANKLDTALSQASDYVTDITSLETRVDLGTWYNLRRGNAQVSFGVIIQPRPDKYYLIEVVDDGGGIERMTSVVQSTIPTPAGDAFLRRETIRSDDNGLRFTANFAKMFFDFLVLRAGIIETSGGVGADLIFFDRRLQIRTDLFNWGGPRNSIDSTDPLYQNFTLPRWRTLVKVQPLPYVYIVAGLDDVLNTVNYEEAFRGNFQLNDPAFHGYGADAFFGVGIAFKDEDLKTVLPFAPSF